MSEWINSDFSHTMKYNSIIKRNKLFRYAVMQLLSQIYHAKWKNTVSKMDILYDFIYEIFGEKENNRKRESIVPGVRGWSDYKGVVWGYSLGC